MMTIGVARVPFADKSVGPVDTDLMLVAEHRGSRSTGFAALGATLVSVYTTLKRPLRSSWRSLAGFAFRQAGIRPPLIAAFFPQILRCLGVGTMSRR